MTAPWLEPAEHWCNECGELRDGLVNTQTARWGCTSCGVEVEINTGVDAEVGG